MSIGQSLQGQKQNFQIQLNEVDSALDEIKGKDSAFKIVGGLMFQKPTAELKTDLDSKKESISSPISFVIIIYNIN